MAHAPLRQWKGVPSVCVEGWRDAFARPSTGYFLESPCPVCGAQVNLGSVRLVVNAVTGAVVSRLDYDVWGNITNAVNPGFQPFGFAGGLRDDATGLVQFGARDYDPLVGRWTGRDPIGFSGGTANLFAYANNDPVSFVDLTGTTLACPDGPPRANQSWMSYSEIGDPFYFHCGFEGYLEKRMPTPADPIGECFYDSQGRLVDDGHPFSGCKGTPDQYPASDKWNHSWNDEGGIRKCGGPAFKASMEIQWNLWINSSIDGLGRSYHQGLNGFGLPPAFHP